MIKEFNKNGIEILKVYFCPHAPDENCECRKPKIGMITQALNDFNIDLQNSWLIGDKTTDIQTAINANIPNRILIGEDSNCLFDIINVIKDRLTNEI